MNYIILLLFSFCLSSEWGTSFSVRTPNDNNKPLDYEISVKLNDTNGKFRYLLKRDWERELGEKYIDDVVNFQHQVLGHFYYGIDYVNKESKDIDYITYNIGATIDWFKAGVSFKEIDKEISPLFTTSCFKDNLSFMSSPSFFIFCMIKSFSLNYFTCFGIKYSF